MIGIFDSSAGGLATLQAVRNKAPKADIIYCADTRSADERTSDFNDVAVKILREKGAAHIVDASSFSEFTSEERDATKGNGNTLFIITKDSHDFRNAIAPLFLDGRCSLEILA